MKWWKKYASIHLSLFPDLLILMAKIVIKFCLVSQCLMFLHCQFLMISSSGLTGIWKECTEQINLLEKILKSWEIHHTGPMTSMSIILWDSCLVSIIFSLFLDFGIFLHFILFEFTFNRGTNYVGARLLKPPQK